jgi:hypothetical protein
MFPISKIQNGLYVFFILKFQKLLFFCFLTKNTTNVSQFFANIVAKLENQNGGLIQDGDDLFFYFSHNKTQF